MNIHFRGKQRTRGSRERFGLYAKSNEKPLEDFQQRNPHNSKYTNSAL